MTSSRVFCPIWAFEGESAPGKEGWRERLQAYYLEQTPKGRKLLYDYASDSVAGAAHLYPSYVASKFWTEMGTVRVTDNDGSFYVWARNLDRALQLQAKPVLSGVEGTISGAPQQRRAANDNEGADCAGRLAA